MQENYIGVLTYDAIQSKNWEKFPSKNFEKLTH